MFFLRFFLFLVRAYDPLVSKLRIFAIEWLVVLEREQDGEGFKEIEERERGGRRGGGRRLLWLLTARN